jgi:exodeoxyribonuclease VII large subunit
MSSESEDCDESCKSEKRDDLNVISVKALNEKIKQVITDGMPMYVKIKGEISNFKTSNGNTWFTLKDADAGINAVAWSKKLELKNGDSVVVNGKVGCFTKSATNQITVYTVKHIGIGELHQQYEELKEKFNEKGYYAHKRELPSNISRIGILTSAEGAALQDIMYVLRNNKFNGEVIIKNCSVQGQHCPPTVKKGIKYFNKLNKKTPIDVLIVARGGGSFEDLMGYSTKDVVRSIFKSPITTISAVGHEVDFMLSDFSADIRAPTPSIAGELVSAKTKLQATRLDAIKTSLTNIQSMLETKVSSSEEKLDGMEKTLEILNPTNMINDKIVKLKSIQSLIQTSISTVLNQYKHDVDKLQMEQSKYDIDYMLKNGYTIVIDEDDNIISSKSDYNKALKSKTALKLMFQDGTVDIA